MLKTLNENGISFRDLLRLGLGDNQANLAKSPLAIADLKDIIQTFEAECHGGSFSMKDLTG